MTREHTKAMLPFITAYANGKVIQIKSRHCNNHWRDVESPDFTDEPLNYRIKQEPREVWVMFEDNGKPRAVYDNQTDALCVSSSNRLWYAKFREVIE